MTIIKRPLTSSKEDAVLMAVQRGFDFCRRQPHTPEELDLSTCSKEELSDFYHKRVGSEEEGSLFKEGVDMFVNELWEDLESRRVEFEDSDKLGELKSFTY